MDSLLQDLRFGVKLLWKDKGFALTAIFTLALCIGANAAVFSVIHAVLMSPLPIPEADRVLLMYNSYPGAGAERGSTAVPDYYDRLRDVDVFEEQALFQGAGLSIGEGDVPERVSGMRVTPSFFRLLRIEPRIGRIFTEEEGEIGNQQKVMLSHAAWQQYYGGDPSALGRDLRINGTPHTVVGVMPEHFLFVNPDARLWLPLAFTEQQKSDAARHSNSWNMIGRLKPGATSEQAQEQIDALNASNLERFPQLKELLMNAGFHTRVVAFQDELVRDFRDMLLQLWGGVLFVLLIGCVNIANLVLVRSSVRAEELATRFALGAGRWRMTRQLLTENVLLTSSGGGLGVLVGFWGLGLLRAMGLEDMPRGTEVSMDATVIGATVAAAVGIGIVMGLIPLAGVVRMNLSSVFREGGWTGSSGLGTKLLRRGLVTAQVAVALILLVGAGLLLASFRQVLAIDPGFEPENVLSATLAPPATRYEGDAELRAFVTRAIEGIGTLPGVVDVGVTNSLPFGGGFSRNAIVAEGYVMEPGESFVAPYNAIVDPGYFSALQIPLVEGRAFDRTDTEESTPSVVVDERMARKFWPDGNAVGKRVFFPTSAEDLAPTEDRWRTVVGVVGTVRLEGLVVADEAVGTVYLPQRQIPTRGISFIIKTATDPEGLIEPVRRLVAGIDAELPLFNVRTMQQRIDESLTPRSTPLMLSTGFAAVALLLSAVGIYGVLAYTVSHRAREIGVRIALGSGARRIFDLVLREGALILVVGLTVGIAGTVALRRWIESLLYEVAPLDPVVLVAVTTILAAVALVACLIPARRAAHIDPVRALKQE